MRLSGCPHDPRPTRHTNGPQASDDGVARMTTEYQDLLAELNACGSDALDKLDAGDVPGCRGALKALLDEIRQNMDTEDEEVG